MTIKMWLGSNPSSLAKSGPQTVQPRDVPRRRAMARVAPAIRGALALSLLMASISHATPDGGYDVELLDAGTVLASDMACMSPGNVQRLDIDLRTTEMDRNGYRAALLVVTPIAVLATAAAVILAGMYVTKR